MAKLEDITVGGHLTGIAGNESVQVVAVQWYGANVIEITYKNEKGVPGTQLLYREDEESIQVKDNHLPWSFDADGKQMRLASEAYRISLAHLFDPYLAVHTSSVEPLPHQISAVYQEMLPRLPLRYVLADDPGAGKTIMTGLFIKEMIARGSLKRCMIVAPGSLVEQWQDELFQKFHLHFEILSNDRIESAATGNVFNEVDLCICRLDKLARNNDIQEKLKVTEWDLIVCDEAHKMSATIWGGEIKYTRRFQLGKLLSNITKNFLLLTATPHNGKEEDFHLSLFPKETQQYDTWLLRELLNNCIAHSNYQLGGRIYINECEESINITNPGDFLPQTIEAVLQTTYSPPFYRNQLLTDSMVNFHMIETAASGIKRVYRIQKKKYFPMPDYNFSTANQVSVTVYGKVMNEQYTYILYEHPELDLETVYLLDQVQKGNGQNLSRAAVAHLRKYHLVEGRANHLYLSAEVAKSVEDEAQYIRNRAFDDKYYQDMIVDYLKKFGKAQRKDFRKLLMDKFPDVLTEAQKERKILTLLSALKRQGKIETDSSNQQRCHWVLKK